MKKSLQPAVFTSIAGQKAFDELKSSVARLRSAALGKFLKKVEQEILAVERLDHAHLILSGAKQVSRTNRALVLPFFNAIRVLPSEEHFISKWLELGLSLAFHDLDTAAAFFEHTPNAMESLPRGEDQAKDPDRLIAWGKHGLDAFKRTDTGINISKVVNTYLITASAPKCGIPLERWPFLLAQALRVCTRSETAAVDFIAQGSRLCRRFNQLETTQWVDAGLEACQSEEELISYFKATASMAVEEEKKPICAIALKGKQKILSIICEAFLGKTVEIRSNDSLGGTPGFSGGPATDGLHIFLPDSALSMRLYKLMVLHQAVLMEHLPARLKTGHEKTDAMPAPIPIHQKADRELIQILPGLEKEMRHLENDPFLKADLPLSETGDLLFKPWWGDILQIFLEDTDHALSQLMEKAAQTYEDLSPELIEALLLSLMASGDKDRDSLWELLAEMLDNIEFASPDAETLQESVQFYFYDEWDRNIGDYKIDWCQVRQRISQEKPNDFVSLANQRLRGTILLIRKQFMKLKPELFKKYKAQPTGDALDIDALVQALIDRQSGASMSENVYVRRDKRVRDVAVFFLVDLSGSTDEKVNGQRVIDIQKDAMVVMSEALEALGDPYAIYGFSTQGRFRVDMFTVKDFNEAYDEKVQYRLGSLEPMGLTRMGTVVRHAARRLDDATATQKLLVVLTDGRPYDMEYGNLEYAIADTKKSIQEARNKGIHPFIITSDKKGSDYLKMISPQTECIIVDKVEQLPTLLPTLYRRMTG